MWDHNVKESQKLQTSKGKCECYFTRGLQLIWVQKEVKNNKRPGRESAGFKMTDSGTIGTCFHLVIQFCVIIATTNIQQLACLNKPSHVWVKSDKPQHYWDDQQMTELPTLYPFPNLQTAFYFQSFWRWTICKFAWMYGMHSGGFIISCCKYTQKRTVEYRTFFKLSSFS